MKKKIIKTQVVKNLYEKQLLTIREIAKMFKVSTTPIAKIVKDLGISRKNVVIRDVKKHLLARIERKENGCWEYNHSIQDNGYARIWNKKAHRVAYETFNNKKIEPGMTIDHLCKNKTCINPKHLEQVTQGENTLRGDSWSGINSRKTHCKRGHLLSGENLAIYAGKRQCRACFKIRHNKYKEK